MAVLWNRNDFLRFRFRFRFRFRTILAQFSNNKKIRQNRAFSVSEAVSFRKLASQFEFFLNFFITFHVGSGSKSGTGTAMHSGSGSAKAKGYGSCSSGSGSTTLFIGT
jgi:hypothetical protein